MTLNVLAHQKDILAAYDVVLKSPRYDHWIILEYESNSNIIKVADTGDGGIEELSRNFAAGRLQYGVGAVKWGALANAKIVLIQWQGEGVPSLRLVTTASHGTELKQFLRGVHVILIARNEEDVDMGSILHVVKRLPGVSEAVPTLTENSEFTYSETTGTTYHAVESKNEIDTNSREYFWKEVRTQEIDRIAEERRREQERNEIALRERNELSERIHAQLRSEEGIKKADDSSTDEIEISFNSNEIITEVDQIDEGWWRERAPDGHHSLLPANYVSLL